MQAVKERYVKLLGVGVPEDVAVTPSTSYAMSLVAASLHLRPEQQIVVLEAQSASNVMQWQVLGPGARGLVVCVRVRPEYPRALVARMYAVAARYPKGRLLSYRISCGGETAGTLVPMSSSLPTVTLAPNRKLTRAHAWRGAPEATLPHQV